jgi:excinuclease ABC subunit C
MLTWNRNNTLKKVVPNSAGVYKFYDANRRLLYVGHAAHLRHRIQSYREVDDLREHPTKAILRPKIKYYTYTAMPEFRARMREKEIKKHARYNYL